MGAPSQGVPVRFPCWCRAVYSWGGESKRDLGFVEGDLIECLNAGDGSWWTGRLRRDRRMVGLFPSNFVQVLDESYQPAPISRNASPLPVSASPEKSKSTFRKPFQAYQKVEYGSTASSRETTPEKEKPKSKWAPYSSMKTAQAPGSVRKAPAHSPLKEEATFRIPEPPPRTRERLANRPVSPAPSSRAPSPGPHYMSRAPSPGPQYMSRAPSPGPQYMDRAPSPSPMYRPASARPISPAPSFRAASPQPQYDHRSHSPNPYMQSRAPSPGPQWDARPRSPHPQEMSRARSPGLQYDNYYESNSYQEAGFDDHYSRSPSPRPTTPSHISRCPSPAPHLDEDASSPPPPPPPHRVLHQQSRAPSPAPHHASATNDYQNPGRQSPIPHSPGMTPSPLRDAMADVMSSLHDMSGVAVPPSRVPSPPGVWSPEAFDQIRAAQPRKAQSSVMLRGTQGHGSMSRHYADDQQSEPSLPPSRDGPPQLSNYVQRMENRLRKNQPTAEQGQDPVQEEQPRTYERPSSAISRPGSAMGSRFGSQRQKSLNHRKSAYELGRTNTTKTSVTSSSSGWQSNATTTSSSTSATSQSVMSGHSAGAFSATSAGSLARRKWGLGGSIRGKRPLSALSSRSNGDLRATAKSQSRPQSPVSGISYHSSHATQPAPTPTADWTTNPMENAGILGGLSAPKAKKSGFFKKMLSTAKTTAMTGAANARSTIGSSSSSRPGSRAGTSLSPRKSAFPDGVTAISSDSNGPTFSTAHRDMGLGGGSEWIQVRRDVNRSNSLSRNERTERIERCQMLDILVMNPVDELMEQAEGDESLDGLPIAEPTDFNTPSLGLVDKGTRFITSLPATLTATTLAQSYLCRPYRSDVQRLRAIFTWVAERVTWEEDFEGVIDTRRVLQTKRGCSEEIATLVRDLCSAVGIHAETVRGYLKSPGEELDLEMLSRPNHWWNAVLVDGEWRVMDCSLAGPTNPKRGAYSSANSHSAEPWYFLARPMEICYTHVALLPEQQHICPPIAHEVLMALPCACPPYFKHRVEVADFDTSMLYLENLEMAHLKLNVPEDVECVAEVEARAFARDMDGDVFESGDVVRKAVFAQPEWVGGRKRFVIKALLPGDEGQGVLKIYAGKRGLMHSVNDNPHPLALALPLFHTGQNPSFSFLTRHPTPHAQRHDLYVVQPQCQRLVMNNTFVFHVRQHPSSLSRFTPDTWGSSNAASFSGGNTSANGGTGLSNGGSGRNSAMGMRPTSPNPYMRPASAMSMISASASQSGSNYSDGTGRSGGSASGGDGGLTDRQIKPAKLAIQSPSGKIIRFTRKQEYGGSRSGDGGGEDGGAGGGDGEGLGSSWETVIKVGEKGTWRGLVLADRSARWCVFGEWECI